jgi:hypothetical protein
MTRVLQIMTRRFRQLEAEHRPEADDQPPPTPAGVDLAGGYGYAEAAKAQETSNVGDIRWAYGAPVSIIRRRRRR